jgi:hypothetical protein
VVPYKRPKYWVALNALPQTAQGKVNRREALALAVVFADQDAVWQADLETEAEREEVYCRLANS